MAACGSAPLPHPCGISSGHRALPAWSQGPQGGGGVGWQGGVQPNLAHAAVLCLSKISALPAVPVPPLPAPPCSPMSLDLSVSTHRCPGLLWFQLIDIRKTIFNEAKCSRVADGRNGTQSKKYGRIFWNVCCHIPCSPRKDTLLVLHPPWLQTAGHEALVQGQGPLVLWFHLLN